MEYIIVDLEWNSAFSEEEQRNVCEIFEIGAVKLNERFEQTDTFYEIIKPQILHTFNYRILKLTNVKVEEFEKARNLEDVFGDFEKFAGKESVIMTWSRSDLPVLIENYKFIDSKSKAIPFMKRYLDLQAYIQNILNISGGNQISLTNAAQELNIDVSDLPPHRAINDSIIAARCLKNHYNEKIFNQYLLSADSEFYARMFFKVRIISDLKNPAIEKSDLSFICDDCGKELRKKTTWKFKNRSFYAIKKCPKCKTKYRCSLQVKETFDGIVKQKKAHKIIEEADEK